MVQIYIYRYIEFFLAKYDDCFFGRIEQNLKQATMKKHEKFTMHFNFYSLQFAIRPLPVF